MFVSEGKYVEKLFSIPIEIPMFIYYAIMTLWMKAVETDSFTRITFRILRRWKSLKTFEVFLYFELFNRNALNTFHKIRRHLNEHSTEPRAPKPTTNSIKLVMNRATHSSSQLSIKVSELHADANGRLEISCMSTIPPKVEQGEMYADFKSYSVKSKCLRLFSSIFKCDLSSMGKKAFSWLP